MTGVPVQFVRADLGVVDDCREVVAAAERRFGRVDILVNAGAITDRGNILNTSPELFDAMMAVNVRGPYFLMQDAARLMIRDGIEGAMVNIGSMSALTGQPFISAYCVSKSALATLTAQHGILPVAQPDSGKPTQHRMDGFGWRRPDPARVPRRGG